jgi:hypothetical protein
VIGVVRVPVGVVQFVVSQPVCGPVADKVDDPALVLPRTVRLRRRGVRDAGRAIGDITGSIARALAVVRRVSARPWRAVGIGVIVHAELLARLDLSLPRKSAHRHP